MALPKKPTGLEHLTRLGPSVYLHEPSASVTSPSKNDPNLILLITWMDAPPRPISKYAAGYSALYPSSKLLICTTTSIDAVLRPRGANLARISPALEVLCAAQAQAQTGGDKVLLHLFSNGGALTAALIAGRYRERTGRAMPVCKMVLDSSPGKATYEASIRALAVALPRNFILRAIGVLLLRVFYRIYRLVHVVERKPDLVAQVRRDLNDKTLFGAEASRVYIYSEKDEMVAWRDVEEHADEGEQLGYVVYRERYADSGHAAHLMKDEKRYWDIVQRIWDGA